MVMPHRDPRSSAGKYTSKSHKTKNTVLISYRWHNHGAHTYTRTYIILVVLNCTVFDNIQEGQ